MIVVDFAVDVSRGWFEMIFYLLQAFTAFESYFSWIMHLHKHFCATFVIFCRFCCLTSLNQHVLKNKYALFSKSNRPFTVVCLVPWSLNRSKAGGDLVFLQTLLLFMCKSWHFHANKPVNMIIYIWKTRRFVTKPGQHQPRFYSKVRALSIQL